MIKTDKTVKERIALLEEIYRKWRDFAADNLYMGESRDKLMTQMYEAFEEAAQQIREVTCVDQ